MPFSTMRYQQVYSSSLFTNVDPRFIYLPTLQFFIGTTNGFSPWTIPNMQVNLSTTSKSAESLSITFAENVGTDDTVVFGPGSYTFPGPGNQFSGFLLLQFSKPFLYNPALGNLLLDVRILDGSGPPDTRSAPALQAYDSPTDEISRVWATNVNATIASAKDSVGLETLIQLSPVPTLTAEFHPFLCPGCPSNLVVIRWPPQPTNFVLQHSFFPSQDASWGSATNQVFGSLEPQTGGWFIQVPASSADQSGFYRLFWSGQ
jgi:hypothetical protein